MRKAAWAVIFVVSLLVAGTAWAQVDVAKIAASEVAYVAAQGFIPPKYTLVTVDPWATAGYTVITAEPVRYVIVLRPWYWREEVAAYVAAHEIGHVLLDVAGMDNTEENAERFAVCFGSWPAAEYGMRLGAVPVGCSELAKQLKK